MIAIEKTCLEHFKYKITHQSNDLKAEDILKILSNPISVKEWTSNNKLLLYFQITTIIVIKSLIFLTIIQKCYMIL